MLASLQSCEGEWIRIKTPSLKMMSASFMKTTFKLPSRTIKIRNKTRFNRFDEAEKSGCIFPFNLQHSLVTVWPDRRDDSSPWCCKTAIYHQDSSFGFYKQTVTHPVSQANYFNHREWRVTKAHDWRQDSFTKSGSFFPSAFKTNMQVQILLQ